MRLRRDLGLHHAPRGMYFHTLQITKSRRFNNCISSVITQYICFLMCLRRDLGLHHAPRGVYFHTLQGTKSATPDALR
jgi:coenzyme F420-reducing hydrogenase alpha subunit